MKKECDKCGIIFFTSPYDLNLVDYVNKFVPAYKIGSGDITYLEIIKKISKKNKPVIFIEIAPYLYPEFGYNCHDLIKFLEKLNYKFLEENLKEVSNMNVDFISLGDLTKNIKAIDFSLNFIK